jgi:transglutaminase-like putative cysteine protease
MSKEHIKKIEKIVDFSNLRKYPEKLPMHWGYVAFFGVSMIAALWQHGHPLLSVFLIIMLFPAGAMALIPYKKFGSEKRFYLQMLIVALSGAWFLFRKQQHVPLDKAVIESCCIIGLCLLFAQRSADYDYLLMIGIFLLLYGALLPRAIFMITLLLALLLGGLLLYASRIKSFAGQAAILKNPRRSLLAAMPMIIIHIIIAGIVFWGVFSLLPTRDGTRRGIFEVSFYTSNESMVPPAFEKWFSFRKVKSGKKGRLINSGKKPTALGKKGAKVSLKKGTYMSSDGNGGGPPGKERVFRVKSPVKLYWLGQLYDRYNGELWTRSKYLQRCRTINYKLDQSESVSNLAEQYFIIEKWISPKLFSAYRSTYFNIAKRGRKDVNIKSTFYNAELAEKRYPALPFTYNVASKLYLPTLKQDVKDMHWEERVKKGFYLRLPRKKISKRLMALAKRLTYNKHEPMQKAVILRDYLRNNFKYKQFSKRVPKQREAVDYFIFDLREGHCEYFASSLAVLARLNGLPARVATGFSPGNYNVLSGFFEVHEYHAHAWTQIYIPNMGWLTFDASPPGTITSRTTPFGFGSFRDPFGDKWRIMPPELTEHTLKYVKKGYIAQLTPGGGGPEYTMAEQALMDISMTPEMLENKLNEFMDRMFPEMKGEGINKISLWYKQIKEQLALVAKNLIEALRRTAEFIVRNLLVFLAVIAIIIAISIEIAILHRLISRRLILKKCRNYYRDADRNTQNNPSKTIELCYLLTRQLLIMAGLPRRDNDELLAYGKSLNNIHSKLCIDTVRIFYTFTKHEYSGKPASAAEAEQILTRTGNICKILYSMIDESKEISKAA